MKILVIFTGGTIGSRVDNSFISLNPDSCRLLQIYRAGYDTSDIIFETVNPFSILSENLTPGHALKLAGIVREAAEKDYDAVIVTHGTDTIQYTASLLEWMCGDIDIPVFIVSSNHVPDDENANGPANFHGAVAACRGGIHSGVYVSYQNPGEDLHIHRGILLLPHGLFSDNLYSVGDKIYATVKNDLFIVHDNDFTDQECLGVSPLPVHGRIPRIVMQNVYPGMSGVLGECFSLENVDAFILTGYHSGTLPTDTDDFIRFCRAAASKNIPVYVCGAHLEHGYASTKNFEELSLISIPWVSPIALYTKLISLSVSGTDIDAL